jgi:hypothetical protein
MEMQFPEIEKPAVVSQEELVAQARQKYGIFNKPLVQQEDGLWYTIDFDGTAITAEKWNEKMDELDSVGKNDRKDLK